MIVFIHPFLNQNVKHTIKALDDVGLLSNVYTTIVYKDKFIYRLLPSKILNEFKRRTFPKLKNGHIISAPIYEWVRLILMKTPLKNVKFIMSVFNTYKIYSGIDIKATNSIDWSNTKVVYAYENGAYNVFQKAKKEGVLCVYDLPTLYWRYKIDIFTDELKRNGDSSIELKKYFESDEINTKKEKELLLADIIFVASNLTKESIIKYHPSLISKIQVNPYGAPLVKERLTYNEVCKVLFVGNLGYAKGIFTVLEVANKLKNKMGFTIIGKNKSLNKATLNNLSYVNYIESLSHDKILEQMLAHDVFLFPSMMEGYGLALTEAMACGCIPIVGKNIGAVDLIKHGVNGFIVESGLISEYIEYIEKVNADIQLRKRMSLEAQKAVSLTTWVQYEQNLKMIINYSVK
jgi:glycosyltransferase involved in cell wall biosynthesis